MLTEVVLAVVASVFTATASVLQRLAAAPAPGELRFSWRLVAFLVHRPLWFLGIVSMILGFLFQLAALRYGDVSFVEPIVASELLFVFAFLAIRHRDEVRIRDGLAAAGMAGSLGAFLVLAQPRGGTPSAATTSSWILAGVACAVMALLLAGLSLARVRRGGAPTPARKAALLGASAGVGWGFLAAVIKELSSHLGAGPYAVFSNWAPYVLLVVGAGAMFLAANAFQAGPLAASQPGLTIVDPLVAFLLGITLFGEHVHHSGSHLAGEAAAAAVLCASVVLLSRSSLIGTERPRRRAPVGALGGEPALGARGLERAAAVAVPARRHAVLPGTAGGGAAGRRRARAPEPCRPSG